MALLKWTTTLTLWLVAAICFGVAIWCVSEGDFFAAFLMIVCAIITALPSRWDPSIRLRERNERR